MVPVQLDLGLSMTKQVRNKITSLLKDFEFRNKGSTWYLESSECIGVLNWQKSKWGNQCYMNLGVFVKELDPMPFPKEYQCHIRGRLCGLVPDEQALLECLNLEGTSSSIEQKLEKVCEAIRKYALPVLLSCNSLKGIQRFLQSEQSGAFLIDANLQQLLDAQL